MMPNLGDAALMLRKILASNRGGSFFIAASGRLTARKAARRPTRPLSGDPGASRFGMAGSYVRMVKCSAHFTVGRSNPRTWTNLDARGRSPQVRSSSPSIVRRRNRGSLPRAPLIRSVTGPLLYCKSFHALPLISLRSLPKRHAALV